MRAILETHRLSSPLTRNRALFCVDMVEPLHSVGIFVEKLVHDLPHGIVKLLPNAEKLAVYVSSCGEFTRVFVPLTKCVSSVLTEGCCVHLMAAGAE